MNIAPHNVEVPFPQAFASRKRSLFPCAPRYSRAPVGQRMFVVVFPGLAQTVRCAMRLCQTRQSLTLQALEFLDKCTLVLSLKGHGYPSERLSEDDAETRLSGHMCSKTILMVAQKNGNARDACGLFIPMHECRGLQARKW